MLRLPTMQPRDAAPSRLAIFHRQKRILLALAVAVVACGLVDHLLHGRRWFLNHFGYGTVEGQILRKLDRAEGLAAVADVLAFGSSFTRTGLSTEPFLGRGLLPFNLATSGGGPIAAYYALDHLGPVLSPRSDKPVILMELSLNPLDRAHAAWPGGGWSEFQHVFSTARSRRLLARHLGLLVSNFRAYSQASEFWSSAIFPSFGYRAYYRQVGSLPGPRLVDFFVSGIDRNAELYGMEDIGGYSPSYTVTANAPTAMEWTPLAIESFVPAKLAFLRLFVGLAAELGSEVVLVPAPVSLHGYHRAFERLAADLEREYPHVRMIRDRDYGLRSADFDPTGHLNIWGADRFTGWLIDHLHLSGDGARLQQKMRLAFETPAIPPFRSWSFIGTGATGDPDDPNALDWSPTPGSPTVVTSPWIPVVADRQYVLEFATASMPGRLVVTMGDPGARRDESASLTTTPPSPALGTTTRFFLRVSPSAPRLRITARYEPAGSEVPGTPARVRLKGLYGHL